MSLFRDFSKEESTAVLRAVKEKLGTSYTVTHLGHAAMVLAMLKFNPPPDNVLEGQSFISPCFMNGRRYLRADPSMTHDHIPVCQAFGVVVFPNVKDYIISSDATNERSAETLIKATKAARTSYQSIREQDSILSESLPIPEYLAGDVFK